MGRLPLGILRRVLLYLMVSPLVVFLVICMAILLYIHLFSLQLPIDLNTLTEAEKLARIAKRHPKKKIKRVKDVEDNFDVNRYQHLWKKKSK